MHIARSTSTGYGSSRHGRRRAKPAWTLLLANSWWLLTPPSLRRRQRQLPSRLSHSACSTFSKPFPLCSVGREGETTSPLRASLRLHVRHEVDHLQFFVTMPKSLIIRWPLPFQASVFWKSNNLQGKWKDILEKKTLRVEQKSSLELFRIFYGNYIAAKAL